MKTPYEEYLSHKESSKSKTIGQILETLNDEQRKAVDFLIANAFIAGQKQKGDKQ